MSYQKKLHEIIAKFESSPEVVLRAISELHRIEMSLHTLLKELPGDIKTHTSKEKEVEERKGDHMTFDEWVTKNARPRVEDDSDYSDEENGQYYWGLHKQYNQYVKQWKDQMFGPDYEPWDDKPLKSIVRIPSESETKARVPEAIITTVSTAVDTNANQVQGKEEEDVLLV